MPKNRRRSYFLRKRYGQTDGPTGQWTNGWMDKLSYRDARTHLMIFMIPTLRVCLSVCASMHPYKRLCPSVRWSFGQALTQNEDALVVPPGTCSPFVSGFSIPAPAQSHATDVGIDTAWFFKFWVPKHLSIFRIFYLHTVCIPIHAHTNFCGSR